MDSLVYSLNATVPIFLIMLCGNLLVRKNMIDRHFATIADKFVYKICLPCLLFANLSTTNIRENFDGAYIGFCVMVTLISILAIWFLARRFMTDKSMTGAFVQGAYRSSAAILGIAFIENIYGTSSIAPLMIIGSVPLYNIFAVLILTLESNERAEVHVKQKLKTALIGILKNPIIQSILLGLLVSYINLPLPHVVTKVVGSFGGLTSTLALLSIGATFEGRKAIRKIKPTIVSSLIKVVGLVGIFLPLAVYLGFRDEKLLALIIMLGSPSTPTSYIMIKNFKGDAVLASSIVVATTLLSSITLTGWIFMTRFLELIH